VNNRATVLLAVVSFSCTSPSAQAPEDADSGDAQTSDVSSNDVEEPDILQDADDADTHTETDTVNGVAQYLKRISNADGTVNTKWHPIRGATIQMEVNGEIHEEVTGNGGEFSFPVVAPAGTNVELVASTLGPRRNAQVIPSPDKPPYKVQQQASADMAIQVEDPFLAGAFNVIDAIVKVSNSLAGIVDDDVPELLLIRWGPVYVSPCISCFHADTNTLDLTGHANDEDAHDDSVLFHELGHYVEATYGQYNNPEMPHDIDQKVLPTLAWSEGFASWFQGIILNTSIYVDLRPDHVYMFDLESPSEKALGTQDNSIDSNYSESLVFGLLWDLTDHPADDDDGVSFATEDVLNVALTLVESGDIGFEGADLADFINRWRCLFNDRDEALETLLKAINFPYDFNQPATCL